MDTKDRVADHRGGMWFPASLWTACLLLAACIGGCTQERPDKDNGLVPATPAAVAATPTPYEAVPTYTPTPIIHIDVRLPPSTPTPTPAPQQHRVEAGDTLIDIAARYGVTVEDLQELNEIGDPRGLQIGQELEIPALHVPEEDANPVRARHALRRVAVAVDGLDIAWAMGEVANLDTVPVEQIRVAAHLQAADGTEMVRRTALAVRHITPPGKAAPFMFRLGEVSQTAHGWTLAVASIKPAHIGGYATELSVGNLRFEPQPSGTVLVSGLVTNHELVAVAEPEVVVTALDAQRRVTAVRVMLPDERTLVPGGEVAFEGVLIPLGEPVTDVTAFAQGFKDE
ncbi:MAG: LysM peptidoglycan-binding domain-containing protein [Caldilineaceae bacterium SB0662_bin_9]|uniref:LysM peptidoglycan-binding domain-containing protein n=1 Tax=Caldilineaceae bacterium SB0662_bin_9 TaxID=2605258 RepID=A0A6B1DR49_9CHLR|nr:LysM peptidoglycan-binding domain-containing protein [Caldilineaceae bacterium SB0662_bin_9]